jgi:SAM-dependent methyltransferase
MADSPHNKTVNTIMTMLSFVFTIIQLGFFVFVTFLCLAFITGAPFVPSVPHTAESMIKLANIKPGMRIYDLGSGEGRLLFLAAQKGATAIGIEINPLLVLFTYIKILFSPFRKTIRVYWKNLWKADISEADVVFIYLIPWRMDKLENMLKNQLKKGSLVVSNSFIFPGWTIIQQDIKNHVYVFRV